MKITLNELNDKINALYDYLGLKFEKEKDVVSKK